MSFVRLLLGSHSNSTLSLSCYHYLRLRIDHRILVSLEVAGVLAPLLASVALVIAFFLWEARLEEKNAAL